MNATIVWIAQGFGVGRSPVAPGTAGSIIGLGWLLLLLASGRLGLVMAGMLAGVAFSIWICGKAEKILGETDPSSVVLDEIVAVPWVYAGWIGWIWVQDQLLPHPLSLLGAPTWLMVLVLFLLFRLFDILKPWPVSRSQTLPGGWGITLDDLLAAGYVNLCWGVVQGANPLFHWW